MHHRFRNARRGTPDTVVTQRRRLEPFAEEMSMHDQLVLDRPDVEPGTDPHGFFDCRGEWQSLEGEDVAC